MPTPRLFRGCSRLLLGGLALAACTSPNSDDGAGEESDDESGGIGGQGGENEVPKGGQGGEEAEGGTGGSDEEGGAGGSAMLPTAEGGAGGMAGMPNAGGSAGGSTGGKAGSAPPMVTYKPPKFTQDFEGVAAGQTPGAPLASPSGATVSEVRAFSGKKSLRINTGGRITFNNRSVIPSGKSYYLRFML